MKRTASFTNIQVSYDNDTVRPEDEERLEDDVNEVIDGIDFAGIVRQKLEERFGPTAGLFVVEVGGM